MLAARWPDDLWGNAYYHPTYHYINYIYAPEWGISHGETHCPASGGTGGLPAG